MPQRPPSPPSPDTGPTIVPSAPGEDENENRIVTTTSQLSATLEESFGFRLDERALENVLLELDRSGYVEWASTTRDGDHVWDLTETPERVADAVAERLVERLCSRLCGES